MQRATASRSTRSRPKEPLLAEGKNEVNENSSSS